jgi:hypothetical protein
VSEFDKKFKNGELVEPLSSRVLKTVSSLFVIEKAIALTSDNPDDYLAEGNEIKFSQAIKDKADLLGPNPLAIFNFVKNNFEYEPYYGSKKGSADTFIEQSGNDVDKSALLIAMLRYKDIPARYRSVYARFDIRTINDLLGVEDANLGAEILTLNKIPNKLYAKNGEPDFFVLEYTYVEAYFPYGYTRGVDISDGGTEVWVPMDPTTNAIYFEQLIDTMGHMNQNGFRAEMFLENYLDNLYDTLTPVEAFISIASSTLSEYPPEYYPDMTFDDSLVKKYPRIQNLEFIPGSLPFIIAGSINKFDFYPELLRHYVNFQIKNENDDIVSQIKLYISDIANKEFLLTNKPATPIDQTIVDSFDTIYDVVPLSLVNIVPVVRIGGQDLLIGTTSYALGTNASYSVEFTRPQADDIFSDNRSIVLFKTHTQDYKNGNTLGIVINASNLVPSEITGNPNTNSYINDQLLYASALDYAVKNQETRSELESIIGGKYMSRGDKISISNNIKVTKQNNIPYSFSWSGLNIDAKLISAYYYRFGNINQYHKEIFTIALTEASLQESTIFESNFDVESVSTVKGLQKVNQGQFPNTTMSKITYQNKAHIDTLNISQSTKDIFHQAITDNRTVYTPNQPITYGNFSGLFYITIDFDGTSASYTIGEGLNGGV